MAQQFELNKPVRFNAEQWRKFQTLGGAAWLRAYLDGLQYEPKVPALEKAPRRKVLDAAYLRGRGGMSSDIQRAWYDGQTLRPDSCYFDQSGERDRVFLAGQDDAGKPRAA